MICNNSRIEAYERCPREYYWSYLYDGTGLTPARTVPPLVDGRGIHAGLAGVYTGANLQDVHLAMVNDYNNEAEKFKFTAKQKLVASDKIQWGKDLLSAYVKQVKVNDTWQVLEVETDFNVVLGEICWKCGTPYPVHNEYFARCTSCSASAHWWVGRADLVVKHENMVAIVDHKTAASVGSMYLRSWEYAMQLIGYTYGIGKANEYPINLYGINVLKKLVQVVPYQVRCTKCRATGQTGRVNNKILCVKCEGHGTITKQPNQMFFRDWFPCPPEKKQRFLHNRITILNQIEDEQTKWDSGYTPTSSSSEDTRDECYPMRSKNCMGGRGSGGCDFIPLCWYNHNSPLKWYDVNHARIIAYFEPRSTDYVELIREEIV